MVMCPIAFHARLKPSKKALIIHHVKYTYKELSKIIKDYQILARKMEDPIVVLQPDHSIESIALYFALLREKKCPLLISPKEPQSQIEKLKILLKDQKNKNLIEDLKEISTLILTSGSTANPKIVALSKENFFYSYLGSKKRLKLSSKMHYLLSLPLSHVSGLSILYRTFYSGGCLHIKPKGASFSKYIKKYQITHLSLIPMQLSHLISENFLHLYSLRVVLIGGSFLTPLLAQKGLKARLPLFYGYALTEGCGTICCARLTSLDPIHCGTILPYRSLSLNADDELILKGKTLFNGYFCIQRQTIEKVDEFATADLGSIRSDGKIILKGRKDHKVKRAGIFIQTEEIEKALYQTGLVNRALVLAIADPVVENEIIAFAQTEESLEKIQERLKELLPIYKRPKHLFLWPSHMRFHEGKITREMKIELSYFARSKMMSKS